MEDSLGNPLIQNGGSESDAQPVEKVRQRGPGQKVEGAWSSLMDSSSAWIWEELEKQLWIAGPMIIVNLLQQSVNVVSISFVGHLGELELASSSVAASFAGVTGTIFLMGMGTSLETLCGQAVGAREYRMVGIYLQRAILALNAAAIPVAFIWANMGAILRALHQDPEISDYAGQYARWLLPMLFAYGTLQPITRYLQTQSAVLPMACCSALTLILHIPICWLLTAGVGYRGAALANGITLWLNVLFLVLYIKFSPKFAKTWTGFSLEAFQRMKDFMWLAVPSAMMICLEYWSFETMILLSGLLPNPQLEMSTLSISMVIVSLLYMAPFGISCAVSTRVSNELGAGRPGVAKRAVGVSLSIALCEGVFTCILLWSLRRVFPYVFTGEREVVEYLASWMPVLAICPLLDAVAATFGGAIRGCGRQHLGAYINLAAFYGVGFPVSITLAFVFHLKGLGLWIGMFVAVFFQATLLGSLTYLSDWQKQAEGARNFVAGDRLPSEKVVLS